MRGDLRRLGDRYGAEVLVTLLERDQYVRDEMKQLGVVDLLVEAKNLGLITDWTALPADDVPIPVDRLFVLVERVITHARDGRIVVMHCRDGLGRTGLVAACCLVALGASVNEALDTLAEIRPGAEPSAAHRGTLRAFDELWRKRALERSHPSEINDLLDMAKIEAGRMEVNLEPICIEDLLEGLTGIMTPQATARSIELDCQVEDDLPQIETDPGKLQQILYNFLSNAIKFTPEHGQVTILAEGADAHVLLSVSDTGPGIAPDMQDLIFEKFRQADASHTREFTGTGLGLAICRELAELLQCELAVDSTPGRGSTFSVTIPVTYTPPKSPSLMG